jgi:F-type H+-transporting ATPase subunit beta
MIYYVYEDLPTSRARIHRANCRFCNHGNGLHGLRNDQDCRWHGPYTTLEEASRVMGHTGRKNTGVCTFCLGRRFF